MPEEEEHKYGEENYKASGSPMFGRLWTFDELETVERPLGPGRGSRKRMIGRDFKRPDNWPPDTEVETGRWVAWLPEGWAQGVRTQALSGKKLSCYMNKDGRRFWHKRDIEKFLGYMLPNVSSGPEPEVSADGATKAKSRYVTDADAIPNWPEDAVEWLPQDWKVGFRQMPNGLHRIFVPPGKEDEGFLYHKHTVLQWINGEINTVSSFGRSKPMAEIAAAAAEKGTGQKRRRTHHSMEARPKVAEPRDFEAVEGIRVVRLGERNLEALQEAEAADAERLALDAQKLAELLGSCKFEEVSLLYVFQQGEQQHPASGFVGGFYYKRPVDHNGREVYQKIVLQWAKEEEEPAKARVACSGFQISWSMLWDGHWKIGKPESDDCGQGYAAICHDSSMQSGWKLLKSELVQKSTQGEVKAPIGAEG